MSIKDALKLMKDEDVEYVDVRFTDPRGKLQHVTLMHTEVDEDFFEEGFMFDGSSIAGWKSIDQSDMKLIPDASSVYIDPFYAEKTMCVHCTVVEPDTGEPYARDPRGTAEKAEAYLVASGIGDSAFFGPEAEFFLFDDVKFSVSMNKVSYEVDALDAAWNTDTDYEMGNMGHRPGVKGGYFPVNPVDDAQDLRSEMLSTMKRMGMKVDKHHHEVASCQHELGLIFGTLTKQADDIQKYKYVIHNVAHAYGKSATFMPKPIAGDNGTGMHVNMSIWKDGKPLFAGDKYADLSQNRQTDYVFTWEKLLALEGNTAAYLMYAYARLSKMLRESQDEVDEGPINLREEAERRLALALCRFPETLESLTTDWRLNALTDHLYSTAGALMKFYDECPVLKEENEEVRLSRLRLCRATAQVLKTGLGLLGISTVDRM